MAGKEPTIVTVDKRNTVGAPLNLASSCIVYNSLIEMKFIDVKNSATIAFLDIVWKRDQKLHGSCCRSDEERDHYRAA